MSVLHARLRRMAPRVRESISVIWDAFPTSLKKMAWATLGLAGRRRLEVFVVIYVFMATLANNLELPSGRHSIGCQSSTTVLTRPPLRPGVDNHRRNRRQVGDVFASTPSSPHSSIALAPYYPANSSIERCVGYANIAGESDGAVRHSLMAEADIVCTQIVQRLVVIIIEASVLMGLVVVLASRALRSPFGLRFSSPAGLYRLSELPRFGQQLGHRVNQFEKERANRASTPWMD